MRADVHGARGVRHDEGGKLPRSGVLEHVEDVGDDENDENDDEDGGGSRQEAIDEAR